MRTRGQPDDRARLEAFAALAGARPATTGSDADGTRRTLGWALVGVGVVLVAALTLVPAGARAPVPFWCVRCGGRGRIDLLLNVLLFAPLGAGLGVLGVRWWRALLLAFLCTAGVELLQLTVVTGRDASARDIVANTLGAALGIAAGRRWHPWMVPHPRATRQVALAASLAWLASQAVTALAVAPWLPTPSWWARITPRYAQGPVYQSTFAGRILSIEVGGVDVPQPDEIAKAWNARDSLLSGGTLRVVADQVRPSEGRAPLVIVTAGPVHDVVSWVQDGRDALFRVSTRGARVGLRVPAVRLPDAMPLLPVDTVVLEGSYAHGRWVLRVTKNGVVRERRLAASASRGWMFLVRSTRYALGPEVEAVTALWLAVEWIVLGVLYFRAAGHGRRAPLLLGALGATMVLGLAGVPLVAGLPIAGWSEWMAASGGSAIAFVLSRIFGRRGALRPTV